MEVREKERGGGGEGGEEKRSQEGEEAMEGLLLTLKVICFEGDASSLTRDLVTGDPASGQVTNYLISYNFFQLK